jgi:hypothetical protein
VHPGGDCERGDQGGDCKAGQRMGRHDQREQPGLPAIRVAAQAVFSGVDSIVTRSADSPWADVTLFLMS